MRMGLECEIPYLSQDAALIVDWLVVDIHNDGSIRHTNYMIDGVAVLPMRNKYHRFIYPSGAVIADQYGAEIVTKPYEYTELHTGVSGMARMFGYVPTTPRASIHVHVEVIDKSWRYVQNLLRWFIHLEAPLFRLSALGEEHRGQQWFSDPQHPDQEAVKQDHNYARPLTDSIGIRRGNRMTPLIDYDDVLSAESASDMVAAWGRLDLSWGSLSRYSPHRLHALNIVPLMLHHTVEWRLFNGRYRYLPKILEIINAVHRLAEQPVPNDFPRMPLGSTPDMTSAMMSDILGVDVRDIWGRDWLPPCDQHAIKSHYDGDFLAPVRHRTPVRPIVNNAALIDDGSDDFCFGVSGNARRYQELRGNVVLNVINHAPLQMAQAAPWHILPEVPNGVEFQYKWENGHVPD